MAREKAKAAPPATGAKTDAKPEDAAAKEADEDTAEPPEKTTSAKPVLDPELERLLADPLRATRARYLPAGRYTLEFRSGGTTATTTMRVKPPKESKADDEDDAADAETTPERE